MNKCKWCDLDTINPSFCNLSCAAKYNNKISPKRQALEKECCECGRKYTKNRNQFCSKECMIKHKDAVILKNKGWSPTAVNRTIREFFIRQNNNHCMICNLNANDWCGKKITLIVDHIDGDCKNQSLDNLRIVCPNCDSQLDTYKAKNKGRSTRGYHIVQH